MIRGLTPGQRWTAASCLALALLVLLFGMPDEGPAPAQGTALRERSPLVASVPEAPAAITTTTTTTLVPEMAPPADFDFSPAPIVDAGAPPVVETTPTTRPEARTTTTTTRPTTTTTEPCALPVAGQCLPVPLP